MVTITKQRRGRMSKLRASVLGGVDGVITSFAVVAGGSAGGMSLRAIGIIGASSVVADGLSMGVSEFLSSTSERAVEENEASVIKRPSAVKRGRPWVLGTLCFLSFVISGVIPLATFLLSGGSVLACAMFSMSELMVLGALRTLFSKEALLRGLLQTLSLGSAAGAVAYAVGSVAHVV